jgi:TPR repeat protein
MAASSHAVYADLKTGGPTLRKQVLSACLCLALAGTATAGTNEEAAAAYKRGDHAEAFRLWHAQAEQGDHDAQAMVAFLYHDGEGVAKDLVRAHMWFELSRSNSPADEQSWHDASEALDLTAKHMTADQIAEAREMARTCQAQKYKNCD